MTAAITAFPSLVSCRVESIMQFSWFVRRLCDLFRADIRRKRLSPCIMRSGEPLEARSMLAAGAIDTSFGSNGRSVAAFDVGGVNSDWARAMTVDASGRTVVVGFARDASGNDDFAIARFLPNGRLDTKFNRTGKVQVGFNLGGSNKDEATAVAIDSKGRIVVAGYAQTAVQNEREVAVARLLPSGRLDTSFSSDGKMTITMFVRGDNRASDIAIDKQGRIILVGQTVGFDQDKDFAVARLTSSGAMDDSFGVAGTQQIRFSRNDDWASAVTLDKQGRIVVVGTVSLGSASRDYDFAVARLLPTGWLDPAFGIDGMKTVWFDFGGNDGNVDAAADVKVDKQGRIVIAGTCNVLGSGEDFAVARLLPGGQLDTSFNFSGKTAVSFDYGGSRHDRASGLQIDSAGRIIVVGTVTRDGNGNTDLAVLRLTPDGRVDNSFGAGTGKATVAFDFGGAAPFRHADIAAGGIGLDSKGRITVAGTAKRGSDADWDFVVARLRG